MMCQKISGRAVRKVSSLYWLSWNVPLKWRWNTFTLVQFGSVDLAMLGSSGQLMELEIVMPPRNQCSVKRSQYLISLYLSTYIGKWGDRTNSISIKYKDKRVIRGGMGPVKLVFRKCESQRLVERSRQGGNPFKLPAELIQGHRSRNEEVRYSGLQVQR